MNEQHVEVVQAVHANPQVRWQPVVGPETMRLLERAPLDDEGEKVVRTESVKLLARCSSPTEPGVRTGLAVGYVQSGKTLSFTTVTALARDNGFPLVILLAGTKINLLEQTAQRLSSDLEVERSGGLSPWVLLQNPTGKAAAEVADNVRSMQDASKPEKFRRATIITVMKHPKRLNDVRDLLTKVAAAGIDVATTPVLLIDDEADQAGLNAAVQDSEKDATATYQSIVDLRQVLPRHTYLMYTATPQANLLVNLADVLSPDFVSVLTPGKGYTGGRYFFEDHKSAFVRRLTANQVTEALNAKDEPPASLELALASYYLAVTQRGDGPVSMLVHPSHTQDLQGTYGQFVQALSTQWRTLLVTPGPDRDELVEESLRPAYDDLVKHGADMRELDELLNELPHWIDATQIRVVNSQAEANQQIKWNAYPSWILIGGNKLDRGFTVEGLTTTYMPRKIGAGQVDTVQQRARFFGYKQAYAPLCRAWLNGDTAGVFEHYVEHERLLRDELVKADDEGMNLRQWKRKMLLDPSFKPTRRAVIDIDYFHDRIRGDSWMSISKVPASTSRGGALEKLWDKHASHAEQDGRDGRGDRTNQKALVSAEEVVEAILDWVTPQEGQPSLLPAPDDVALLNQAALLLRARVDEDPSLTVDLYSMDDGHDRSRTATAGAVDLPTGRSNNYKGDDHFFTEGTTSVQLHRVNVNGGPSMLGLRLRVPKPLAGGVLVQA